MVANELEFSHVKRNLFTSALQNKVDKDVTSHEKYELLNKSLQSEISLLEFNLWSSIVHLIMNDWWFVLILIVFLIWFLFLNA